MSIVSRARAEIAALAPYSSARMEARGGAVFLNANENPWPSRAHTGAALNRYPDPQPAELVRAMAAFYGVDPAQVLVTRGSDEGIDLLVRAFCRAGKDEIVQCPPCFGMYQVAAGIQGSKVVSVPLLAPNFELDADGLLDACNYYTKIVFLTSPNNPTGNSIGRELLLDIVDRLQKKTLVAVDEAYIEFSDQDSIVDALNEYDNVVVFRTLSKAFALAGARCGAVLADPSVIDLLKRIIPPYPLPTPTVRAALGVLESAALQDTANKIRRIKTMRDSMSKVLTELPLVEKVWPSDGNFLLVRFDDAPKVHETLLGSGIVLRDFSAKPALGNCLRITIGTEDENTRLLQSLKGIS